MKSRGPTNCIAWSFFSFSGVQELDSVRLPFVLTDFTLKRTKPKPKTWSRMCFIGKNESCDQPTPTILGAGPPWDNRAFEWLESRSIYGKLLSFVFVNLAPPWASERLKLKKRKEKKSTFIHRPPWTCDQPWGTGTRVAWRTGSTTVFRDKEEVSVGGSDPAASEVKCGAKNWGFAVITLNGILTSYCILVLSTYHPEVNVSVLFHTVMKIAFYAFCSFFSLCRSIHHIYIFL